MDLLISKVPVWLLILFVISFATLPVFLISSMAKAALKEVDRAKGKLLYKRIVFFYWSYFLIISIISLTGFFVENVIPPRIIITTIIPLFLFYVIYVQKTNWFQLVWKHIKLEQLVFIHLFRFVGVFFFLTYFYDAIPKKFAFVGGVGDILTAILVIPVVWSLRIKNKNAKIITKIWNVIGLLDIVCVLITATFLTKQAIETNTKGVAEFGIFPFSWIPAFAPATIIFLHILIFKKIKEM